MMCTAEVQHYNDPEWREKKNRGGLIRELWTMIPQKESIIYEELWLAIGIMKET